MWVQTTSKHKWKSETGNREKLIRRTEKVDFCCGCMWLNASGTFCRVMWMCSLPSTEASILHSVFLQSTEAAPGDMNCPALAASISWLPSMLRGAGEASLSTVGRWQGWPLAAENCLPQLGVQAGAERVTKVWCQQRCLCEFPPFPVKSVPQGWDSNTVSCSLSESPMSSIHSLWYWGMGPLSWCMTSRTHKGTRLTGQSLTTILLQVEGGERSCQGSLKTPGGLRTCSPRALKVWRWNVHPFHVVCFHTGCMIYRGCVCVWKEQAEHPWNLVCRQHAY